MTIKPVNPQSAARRLPPLPEPAAKGFHMQQTRHFVLPGVPNIVARHLRGIISRHGDMVPKHLRH